MLIDIDRVTRTSSGYLPASRGVDPSEVRQREKLGLDLHRPLVVRTRVPRPRPVPPVRLGGLVCGPITGRLDMAPSVASTPGLFQNVFQIGPSVSTPETENPA